MLSLSSFSLRLIVDEWWKYACSLAYITFKRSIESDAKTTLDLELEEVLFSLLLVRNNAKSTSDLLLGKLLKLVIFGCCSITSRRSGSFFLFSGELGREHRGDACFSSLYLFKWLKFEKGRFLNERRALGIRDIDYLRRKPGAEAGLFP